MGIRARAKKRAVRALDGIEQGVKRARRALAYEGATTSRRGNGWTNRGSSSPNDHIKMSIERLRQRSRMLCDDHWAAKRARSVLTSKIVGTGILPSCRDKEAQEFDALLRLWAKPQTQVGAEKGQSLAAVQRVVVSTVIEAGSALVVRRWQSRREIARRNLVMPFDVMVLQPEYLDSSRDGVRTVGAAKHLIVCGIEFDPTGWPVAYWLHPEHPNEAHHLRTNESIRVDARDVSHVFWRERSGQVIGVPWFAAVLLKLKDFDEYEDAELLRAKIASMFVAFIRNDSIDADIDEEPLDLEPGRLQYLDVGEDVEFSAPPATDGFAEFSTVTLRGIAAGLGLSYEDLSNDYSKVNFSSARMGAMVTNVLNDTWQGEMMIGMLCADLERWAQEGAFLLGIAPGDATWTAPGRELIDPSREVGAIRQKIDAGITSRDAEIRKMGRDPVEVDEERRIASDRENALGLDAPTTPSGGAEALTAVREILTELRDR